ncbi:MAG TPA: arginase family protein [Stellaceae bacterium]|nr:arginase family protein [Stellaceae bacterium]
MGKISLIGAASGWGAGLRATEDGPVALRDLGLAGWLNDAGIAAEWQAMIEPTLRWRGAPELARYEIYRMVTRHNAALADAVAAAMAAGNRPVVIGGDHAGAIGTWGGVARGLAAAGGDATGGKKAPVGLIWFDAHLDAHTIATSPSLNPHGMHAAVLLGHGEEQFLAIGGHVVRPENLCYIGARSYESGEIALLRRLGVRIFQMPAVRRRGLDSVLADAVTIATTGTAGFGVTIDLDGFEPEDAPGIGLKTENGLRRDEMLRALAGLGNRRDLAAIEIVEYIPELDEEWRTAHLVRDLLIALLAPERLGLADRTKAATLITA